jgi:hypothetical protein
MGQYYKAIILGKRGGVVTSFHPHYYGGNGAKLIEHSFIGNYFCNAVENYLIDNPSRVVWGGDYADNEKGRDGNLYDLATKKPRIDDGCTLDLSKDLFVINHTKKVYYRRGDIKPFEDEWTCNPLPILTCEGNGRGGGDYYCDEGADLVGTWARDVIEVSATEPTDYKKETYFFRAWK